MKRHLFPSLLLALVIPHCALALEPAPLVKDDAVRTLLSMGYERVKVVAIVDGVHQKKVASMSCATVIGLGRRDGCDQEIVQSLFYDRDLGWFYFETVEGRMRIWNRDGFQEFRP